jgi:hypothetical protein
MGEPAGTFVDRAEPSLILGTTNSGRVREFVALLEPHGSACRSLAGPQGAVEMEDTGTTFAGNAALKATLQAQALNRGRHGAPEGRRRNGGHGGPYLRRLASSAEESAAR